MKRKKHQRTHRVALAGAAGLALACTGAAGPAVAAGGPGHGHGQGSTRPSASATTGDACDGTLSYTQLDTSATASTNTRHVAVADLDGDGTQDVVAANLDDNSVTVLLGQGDGTFATGTTYAVGTRPYQTAVADFDGDGSLDLATTDFGERRSVSC